MVSLVRVPTVSRAPHDATFVIVRQRTHCGARLYQPKLSRECINRLDPGGSLKAAFGLEALADLCDSCFASIERVLTRMNRVDADHEIVGILDSRTQNETGVFADFEFEVSVRLFEHRQLALAHDLRRGQLSFMQGDPRQRGDRPAGGTSSGGRRVNRPDEYCNRLCRNRCPAQPALALDAVHLLTNNMFRGTLQR